MDSREVNVKLVKAQEVATKKQALLVKYEAKAKKQLDAIRAKGWNEEDRYCRYGTAEHDDAYWAIANYESTLESIKDTKKAIKEKEEVVKKWEARLANAKEAEERYAKSYPTILKSYRDNLVDAWDKQDELKRQHYKDEYSRMSYKEFIKKYTYSAYRHMTTTSEEFHKDNVRSADTLILNLWNRIKDRVGDVKEWNLYLSNGNSYEGVAINGFVVGEKGNAHVNSILAGGYNIQRLHVRVLVS